MEFFLLWYITGVIGAALVWRNTMLDDARWQRRAPVWCPTPRAIIFGLFAGIIGPVLLIVGVFFSVIDWLVQKEKTDNWFTRPICKRDH